MIKPFTLPAFVLLCAMLPLAHAEPSSGLTPAINQAEYNEAMVCIGRNEAEMDMVRRVAPFTKDPAGYMGVVEVNAPVDDLTRQLRADAAHSSNQLDIEAGEASRRQGRALFDDRTADPMEAQYNFLLDHSSLTTDCVTRLTMVSARLSAHRQARQAIETGGQ